jgi:hypothetical protein
MLLCPAKLNAIAFSLTLFPPILFCQFSQNKDLLERLLSTAGTTLVEASPYDRKWGIGLSKDDPRAPYPDQWLGDNLLGQVLTEVRDELLKNHVAVVNEDASNEVWNFTAVYIRQMFIESALTDNELKI